MYKFSCGVSLGIWFSGKSFAIIQSGGEGKEYVYYEGILKLNLILFSINIILSEFNTWW